MGIVDELREIAERVQRNFEEQRRLLSFQEYLELFAGDPVRYTRDAARYLRDAFDHYGKTTVEKPWGTFTRYRLFDLPFLEQADARREQLIGQEFVQSEIYRVLSNFAREGRPNRVTMLHGPNGSAKSTVAACIMRHMDRTRGKPPADWDGAYTPTPPT
jgi:predicted Ser/Thr protein kinase